MRNSISITLTNIGLYQSIVTTHYQQYQELADEHNKLSLEQDDPCTRETDQTLYRLQRAMDCETAIIVAFSYMTIEAFCNVYLAKHLSKRKVEKIHFLKKLDTTISLLFAENEKSVSKNKAHKHYGADIQKLADMRNAMVHRHPVRFDLSLKSVIALQKGAAAAARQIEQAYLRRVSISDVEMAATAYTKLLDSLTSSGIDLSKLPFEYKG